MHALDWLIIVAYFGCVLALGRYFARRQRHTDDYFLGGGSMPWMAVALSVVASLASTVGYLGTPGEVIQNGLGLLVGQLSIPAALLVIVLVIVPFYKRAQVTTAFELLGLRYGTSTRLIGVVIWAYMQVAFLGLVLLLASRLIAQMAGIPDLIVITVIGLASVMYTSGGGMQSVVWTDVFQFVILFLGAVVTVGVIAVQTGTGLADWWRETTIVTHELPPWFSTDMATRHTVLGTLFFGFVVNISYASSEQMWVQRYGATRRAVAMMLANYGAGILFTLLQFTVGAALLVYFLKTPDSLPAGVSAATDVAFADKAFPHFIMHHLPLGMTGFVIAALLGAAQSTVDSGVNSMSAVISNDVLPVLKNRRQENSAEGHQDQRALETARWAARCVGAGVVAMAIAADSLPGSNNIIDIAQKVVHLGLGPMGALFLVAMVAPYAGTIAANTGVLAGFLSAVGFAFHETVLGKSLVSPLLIIPLSWLVTLITVLGLGLVFRSTAEESTQAGNHHSLSDV